MQTRVHRRLATVDSTGTVDYLGDPIVDHSAQGSVERGIAKHLLDIRSKLGWGAHRPNHPT